MSMKLNRLWPPARKAAARSGRLGLAAFAAAVPLLVAQAAHAAPVTQQNTEWTSTLSDIARQHGLVGLSGAYFNLTQPAITVGAAGVRRAGGNSPIQAGDQFHVGSNAKSMTATVMATLVRDGYISWNTTLQEALPDLAAQMHPSYRTVTVRQLLTMRAGLEPLESFEDVQNFPVSGATVRDQRFNASATLLSRPPAFTPGSQEQYSNGAYVVAGAIIEKMLNRPWESAMQERIFGPLGISGRPGWPGQDGSDQPWGHVVSGGEVVAVDPNGEIQIPAFLVPAGDMSLSTADFAHYVQAHLAGLYGMDAGLGLSQDLFLAMHNSEGRTAMGWGVELDSPIGRLSIFDGSAGTYKAIMAISWDLGIGAVILTNLGIDENDEPRMAGMLAALNAAIIRASTAVPEPGSLAVAVTGLMFAGMAFRRRQPAVSL